MGPELKSYVCAGCGAEEIPGPNGNGVCLNFCDECDECEDCCSGHLEDSCQE
jgi:hypothetical protein